MVKIYWPECNRDCLGVSVGKWLYFDFFPPMGGGFPIGLYVRVNNRRYKLYFKNGYIKRTVN